MGQCVNELRLTQCLSSKALRPSADCGFVPQCHPDKSSVARYFIDKAFMPFFSPMKPGAALAGQPSR
jgi:hypothetical protein